MGWYIRKAIRVGPFRFNLSKSGIGISAGVKGFRVGAGPRGNYVHMGRGGLYYRETLPALQSEPRIYQRPPSEPVPSSVLDDTVGEYSEVESAEISSLSDSSFDSLISEISEKRRRLSLGKLSLAFTLLAGLLVIISRIPTWASILLLALGGAITIIAFYFDVIKKSTVLLFDLDSDTERTYDQLQSAFDSIMSCNAIWHVEGHADVRDRKYHAGASSLIKKKPIAISKSTPSYVKSNVLAPTVPVGRQTLFFFPNCVLVTEGNRVGAISYESLHVTFSDTRFIEDGSVPQDSTVVGQTWRYVNKGGGPDRRFNNNRQLPIVHYKEVHFTSSGGLNELIQCSNSILDSTLERATVELAVHIKKIGTTEIATGRE